MFLGIFLNIVWKMNFNYSVHISFKNYVISKGDPPSPPCHLPVIRLGYPRPPPISDDVIFAQPLTSDHTSDVILEYLHVPAIDE